MKNPAIIAAIALTCSAAASAATLPPITDCIRMSQPYYEVNLAASDYVGGVNKIAWSLNVPGELSVDKECPDPICLYQEDKLIGEIFAATPDDEPYACAFFSASFLAEDDDDDSGLLPSTTVVIVGMQFGYDPIAHPGTYTIVIPRGFFLADGRRMPEGSIQYHIAEFAQCKPENGTKFADTAALNRFDITYKGITELNEGRTSSPWGNDWRSAKMHILLDGEDVTSHYAYIIDKNTVKFYTPEGQEFDREEGTLDVTIDPGFFFNKAERDAAYPIYYSFSVGKEDTTAVDTIQPADDLLYTVYSFQGVCLLREASADALRSLPHGLYIVNGNKVKL